MTRPDTSWHLEAQRHKMLPSAGVSRFGGVGRAAGLKVRNQRFAHFSPPAAAVLAEEQRHVAQAIQVGAVDDRPAMARAPDQAGMRQDRKMRGKGVVLHRQGARDIAAGQAVRLMLYQQTKDVEAT